MADVGVRARPTPVVRRRRQLAAGVVDGAYWQLVTSTFTHVGDLAHRVQHVRAVVLGPQLELLFGRVRFLALYFLSGLAGSAW